jgi:hypothetical protein
VSGSTVPVTLAALVDKFKAAIPTFQVVDGPDYDARTSFLAVGWDGEDEPAIVVQRSIADARRGRDQETYDVTSLISVHDASTDPNVSSVRKVRETLFAAFESIMQALDADQTLGGAVTRAWITEYAYVPVLAESGATASLRFTVNVTAWK